MAKRIIAIVLALTLLCSAVGTVAAAITPGEIIGNVEEWVDKYVENNGPTDALRDFIVDTVGLSEYVCSSKLNAMTVINGIVNGFDLTHDFGEPYKSDGMYYHTCTRETCGATYPISYIESGQSASAYLTYSHYANGKFYFDIHNNYASKSNDYTNQYEGVTRYYRDNSGSNYISFSGYDSLGKSLLYSSPNGMYGGSKGSYTVDLSGVQAPMYGEYRVEFDITSAGSRWGALAISSININNAGTSTGSYPYLYSGWRDIKQGNSYTNGVSKTLASGVDLGAHFTNKKVGFHPSYGFETTEQMIYIEYYAIIHPRISVSTSFGQEYEALIPKIMNISGELVVVGDNNEISYYDNANFINQENKTVYNPTTNEYYDYNTFVYDSDNRQYTFYNSTGDVVTQITYSNESVVQTEYITIDNTTVINEYHYYYYTGGGGEPVEPTPTEEPGCEHSYLSEITLGTCTVAGLVTYVCELCGHTYMEAIPANGHDWLLIEEIPEVNAPPDGTICPDCGSAVYSFIVDGDSCALTCSECLFEWTTANVMTDGYSLYRCSVCGEEHKDYDGSFDDSGIFKAIGKFLADAIQWILDKLTELVDAINGLVDGFAEYAKLAAENKSQVAEFFTAIIEFIPPQLMSLIWLSIVGTLCVIVFKKWFG